MNYLDEHLKWIQQQGIKLRAFDDVDPIPNVPDDCPEELRTWFEQRMPNRVGFQALGYSGPPGHWMQPEYDKEEYWSIESDGYEEVRRHGLFPLKPLALVSFVHGWHLIECEEGEREGWLFTSDLEQPELGGPMATSLGQFFYAVRTLVEVGILQPKLHHLEYGAKPPLDTPLCLISYSCLTGPVGHVDEFPIEQEPIAPSIRDLLPDFEFVMPLVSPDNII